jgi:hypothetical protein
MTKLRAILAAGIVWERLLLSRPAEATLQASNEGRFRKAPLFPFCRAGCRADTRRNASSSKTHDLGTGYLDWRYQLTPKMPSTGEMLAKPRRSCGR